jgi:hypothetical protein
MTVSPWARNQLTYGPLKYTQEGMLVLGFVAICVQFVGNVAAARRV